MNKPDLDKIAVALIEKYGAETGVELLTLLIQEINKPAETHIIRETTPYFPSLPQQSPWDVNKVYCTDSATAKI